ncbi:MAG: MFS transporter [Burkholderiales bacterium]|nr:MFS transporter [Burkholderiales bacterium]
MIASIERLTGLEWRSQGTVFLVGFGHAGTHWIIGSIYVLLPFIQRDLELSYTAVGALFTIFHFSAFAANFASGLLVDVTGRRVLLMVLSLSLGALAFMACGWAMGMTFLVAMMMLIGATNNLWHPPAISFLSRLYPNSRGYALSIHAFGASFGDIVAPLAMGVLLLGLTWQSTAKISALPVFLIAALIGAVLMSRDSHLPGQNDHTKRGMSLGEYFTGIVTLLRDRAVVGLALMAGVRSMAQSGLLLFIPLYLANVLQVGPTLVGIGIAAMQFGGMIAGPIAGTWSDRIGRRPVVLAGLSGSTVAIAALTLAGNEVLFIAGISLLGFLLFAVRPVVHSWMMDLTPPDMAGSATSVLFGAQSLLSGAAPLAGGMIADTWGLAAVFYALAGTMLVANVMVYLLPRHDQGHFHHVGDR